METFDITVNNQTYSVIPGSLQDGLYLIRSGDVNFAWIQMNEDEEWVEIDPDTKLRVSGEYDEHINAIGMQIDTFSYYTEY